MYVQYTTAALAFSMLAPMVPTIANAASATKTDSFIWTTSMRGFYMNLWSAPALT